MNLAGKKVWDLTLDEIEYLYNHLHLNNYVYAALQCFHKSRPPLNKIITIKEEEVPLPLHTWTRELAGLSPYLGNDDPGIIRINYTYYAYQLFRSFRRIKKDDIKKTIELLATLAYIPVIAEKNDHHPLWFHPVIRKPDDRTHKIFHAIKEDMDIPSFFKLCLFHDETIDEYTNNPLKSAFLFMRAVQSIIIMTENNEDRKRLAETWKNLELNLVRYEEKNGLRGTGDRGNMKNPGQLRYRNTIYLYGGDFFRRMKENETAFEWYTKDIYFRELPELFMFYLTDMKTTERLLCAYRIAKKNRGDGFLKKLIYNCMEKICRHAAGYAGEILEFISLNPGADLSLSRIPVKEGYKLYAGEASREIFLISLLYHSIINGVNYEDINYHQFLHFR